MSDSLPSAAVITKRDSQADAPPPGAVIQARSAPDTQANALGGVQGMPLNTDPLPSPQDRYFSSVTREGPVSRTVTPPDWKVSAAERGVSIEGGLQGDIRSDLGFSPNEAFSLAHIQKNLAKKYGIDEIDPGSLPLVRLSPEGKFEYYNKDDQRYAAVDESGLSMGDLKDLYGPALTLGGELAGTAAGFLPLLSGPQAASALPYTTTGLGAVGAFIGEHARLSHGRKIGVHDLSYEDMFIESLKVSGIALGGGIAGELGSKLISGLRRFVSPEGLSAKHADDLLERLKDPEVQAELREINSVIERQNFKLDIASATGDLDALRLRDAAAKASQAGDSFASKVEARQLENESALTEYLSAKTGVDDIAAIEPEGAGRQVQSALRQRRQEIEAHYEGQTASAVADSRRVLDELADFDETAAGREARSIAQAHADSLRGVKNQAYQAYEQVIGQTNKTYTSNIEVPISDEILKRQKEVQKLLDQSLIGRQVSGTNALDVSAGKVDLAVLDDNIKTLRAAAAKANSGNGPVDFDATKAIDSADALAKMRDDYLKANHREAYSALMKAEADNTVYKDFTANVALKTILRKDGVVNDHEIFGRIFARNDAFAMRELAKVAQTQPGATSKLQELMLKYYRANYTADGVPDTNLHERFIAKHGNVLAELFPGDKRVFNLGQLANRVSRNLAREERVVRALDGTVLGKFARSEGRGVAPENLGKKIFTDGVSNKDVRQVRNILDAAPNSTALNQAWRESVGHEIYNKISSNQVISPTALDTLLKNNRGAITAAMGDDYVRGLETLRSALMRNRLNESGKALERTGLLGMLARATINPPLSRGGRFQTLVQIVRWEESNRAIIAALQDPQVLRSIVYNAERDIQDKHVVRILSQIGATGAAIQDDGTLPQAYREEQQ